MSVSFSSSSQSVDTAPVESFSYNPQYKLDTVTKESIQPESKNTELSIEGALQAIQQIAQNHAQIQNPCFLDFFKSANQQSDFKKAIIARLEERVEEQEFTDLPERKRLSILNKILNEVGHFPATDALAKEDEQLLQKLKKICETFTHYSAYEIIHAIDHIHLPNLAYNCGSFFSQEAAEKISLLKDVEEEIQWQQIFDLVNETISRFTKLKNRYEDLGNHNAKAACVQVLSRAHEELADHHFDYSKYTLGLDKQQALVIAIDLYQQALELETEHAIEIHLSIVYAKYELSFSLQDLGYESESIEEMKSLLEYLEKYLPPSKYCDSKPEVIQYMVEALAFLHKASKNDLYRTKISEALTIYVPHFTSKQKPDLDTLNLLQRFVHEFKINELYHHFALRGEFTMAPASDPDFAVKRLCQLSVGVKTAATDEFTKSFAITLKNHQRQALEACFTHLNLHKKGGFYTIPTGGGKTILMVMKVLAVKMPTLIIVPSLLLMEQTIENIKKISPKTSVNRFDGLAKDRFTGEILVTTYQSLHFDQQREFPRLPLHQFGLVFADEAHRGLTKERASVIFSLQKHAYVFGLTATDTYDSVRKPEDYTACQDVFGPSIYGIELLDLINKKQLAPVKNVLVHAPNIIIKKKKATDEFTDKEIAEQINRERFNSIVRDIYFNEYDPYTQEKVYGQSALVFCAGIEHADTICEIFNRAVTQMRKHPLAATVHSQISPNERNRRIKLHKQGLIPVLVGDSVFAEGYDNPADSIGFFLRPTRSTVFSKQRAGRLLRLFEGKEKALIFDWVYKDLDQKTFREFLDGNSWAGLDTKVPLKKEPRKTQGYQVNWAPDMPKNCQSSSLNSMPQDSKMSVEDILSTLLPTSTEVPCIIEGNSFDEFTRQNKELEDNWWEEAPL